MYTRLLASFNGSSILNGFNFHFHTSTYEKRCNFNRYLILTTNIGFYCITRIIYSWGLPVLHFMAIFYVCHAGFSVFIYLFILWLVYRLSFCYQVLFTWSLRNISQFQQLVLTIKMHTNTVKVTQKPFEKPFRKNSGSKLST